MIISPLLALTSGLLASTVAHSDASWINLKDHPVRVKLAAEAGFVAPVAHTIILSKGGTRLDFVDEGGQDNLFPFVRLDGTIQLGHRHAVGLLFQPLQLNSEVVFGRDVVLDGETFAEGTPVDVDYGFTFWRGSYLYRLWDGSEGSKSLWVGASLQLRNATIDFTSADGERRVSNRDIGPVPLLKALWHHAPTPGRWYEVEVDGIWAPVRYFNGGSNDVEGALLDASVRYGFALANGIAPFVSLRYLAGGATGTGSPDNLEGDGYVSNWLHFVTVAFGVAIL